MTVIKSFLVCGRAGTRSDLGYLLSKHIKYDILKSWHQSAPYGFCFSHVPYDLIQAFEIPSVINAPELHCRSFWFYKDPFRVPEILHLLTVDVSFCTCCIISEMAWYFFLYLERNIAPFPNKSIWTPTLFWSSRIGASLEAINGMSGSRAYDGRRAGEPPGTFL